MRREPCVSPVSRPQPERRRWRCISRTFGVGLLLPGSLLVGCGDVPSTPSDHGWRTHARRDVDDVVSALGTTEMVLRLQEGGRLVANYGRVTIAHAEKSAGDATGKFSAEQPPRADQQRFSVLSNALDRAGGMITDARITLLNHDDHACDTYCPRLSKMSMRIRELGEALSDPPVAGGR